MGYFDRKRDRRRSRELIRAMDERAASETAWEALPDGPPAGRCFLRFSVGRRHEESGRRAGIFHVAYEVARDTDVDGNLRRALRACLAWFEGNLHAPRDLDAEHAVFFFKSEARESVSRVWELLHLLREAGLWAEMHRVDGEPGRVLYEDELQVAVEPWRDRPVP